MQFYLNHYLSNSLGEPFFTSLVHLFMPRNEGSMLFMKKHHKVSFFISYNFIFDRIMCVLVPL